MICKGCRGIEYVTCEKSVESQKLAVKKTKGQ